MGCPCLCEIVLESDHMGVQEITEMLAGRLSAQDEDEVEDELASLQRERQGPVVLPNAPVGQPVRGPEEDEPPVEERARSEPQGAMLAS